MQDKRHHGKSEQRGKDAGNKDGVSETEWGDRKRTKESGDKAGASRRKGKRDKSSAPDDTAKTSGDKSAKKSTRDGTKKKKDKTAGDDMSVALSANPLPFPITLGSGPNGTPGNVKTVVVPTNG